MFAHVKKYGSYALQFVVAHFIARPDAPIYRDYYKPRALL